MAFKNSFVLAFSVLCAAVVIAPAALMGQDLKARPAQFDRGYEQPRSDYFRRDDDYRRGEDRGRSEDYDERRRDQERREDRRREDQRREEGRREEGRREEGRRENPQVLGQQIRDAQQRHNQGVVALQQQFNQRQITRPQMDAGIRQLEVQMNIEIQRAQEAQRR